MRAVVLEAFGGPEGLKPAVLPDPVPGPGEVLLRVRACALNHLDIWIRRGLPSAKTKLPFVLGCDVAGEAGGRRWAVHPGRSCGDCAACRADREPDCASYGLIGAYGGLQGGYAELIAVPESALLPVPDAMSFEQAAAVPLTFLTAWNMLSTRARLKAGETVLVVGAGAGVSVAAIQIAKLLGARVVASSRSAEKRERARALGADETLDHAPADLPRAARKLTGGAGFDVVFEHLGGETFSAAVKSLSRSGRLVTCGATLEPVPPIDLRYVFDRRLEILGAKMGTLGESRAVWEHVAAGRLKPVVDRAYPLDEARAAHERLESGAAFGKVVLRP